MKHPLILLLAVITLLISGCATVAEQRNVLLTKDVRITAYGDMQYSAISMDQPQTLILDGDSPVFAFPSGNSYFSGVALPKTTQPRFFAYQSTMSGSLMSQVSVLIPRFVFLDAEKKLLGTAVASAHYRRNADLFHKTSFSGRIHVPPAAEYVVISASDKTAERLFAFSANGTRWPVALAPAGELNYSVTTQAVATIADSGVAESSKKAKLFMVTEIDGQSIPNSSSESSRASTGTGFHLNTIFTTREVAAKAMKVKLLATHITGAPIHMLFSQAAGTFFSVEGTVDFNPVAGGSYIVKGELKKEGSSVWVEDINTGQPVTEKIIN